VSKAVGVPLAKLATKVMMGKTLQELGFTQSPHPRHIAVKEAVFPFSRFPNVDILLGPEMKSTGEVMGIDQSFGPAYAKSQMAAGYRLPTEGSVFISVQNRHKERITPVAHTFQKMGFRILATTGTAAYLKDHGVEAETIYKVSEGRPHALDYIKNGAIQLIINTSMGRRATLDSYQIRRSALIYNILHATTIAGARAIADAIAALRSEAWQVKPLQDYHFHSRPPM
ncbi:MAG: carbamoyl phosphate synthase large subunit, partial [Deltaproteobacteria bacterium]|nr:carbamoyl phosphate synthase large subunit [Deltaproteobacteria bacterium]